MSEITRDAMDEPARKLAAELQWVDDELAVPSEDLLVWLAGDASDAERLRLGAALEARSNWGRSALWRAAPVRTSWRLLAEHRGAAALCACALLMLTMLLTRSTPERAAQALDAAQFAQAHALLDPEAADQGWTFGGSMLRSSPEIADERRPLSPCGLVIESRPRFEWLDEAPRVLSVLDFEGRELWSWRGTAREVEYGAALPLAEGGCYRAVVTLEGERRAPLGLVFTVASPERRRLLEAALLVAQSRAGDDERCAEFARAAVLARAGFTGDAGRSVERLARSLDGDARAQLARFLIERSAPRLAERVQRSR